MRSINTHAMFASVVAIAEEVAATDSSTNSNSLWQSGCVCLNHAVGALQDKRVVEQTDAEVEHSKIAHILKTLNTDA